MNPTDGLTSGLTPQEIAEITGRLGAALSALWGIPLSEADVAIVIGLVTSIVRDVLDASATFSPAAPASPAPPAEFAVPPTGGKVDDAESAQDLFFRILSETAPRTSAKPYTTIPASGVEGWR